MRICKIVLVLFFVCIRGGAQDVTESPTSTVKGAVQVELATSYESFKEGELKSEAFTLSSFLVLYGVSDEVELRLGLDHQQESVRFQNVRQGGTLSGFSPLLFGVGADIIKEKGVLPKITLITDVFFPNTGGRDFRQEKLGVSLKTVFFHNLGKNQNAQLNYNIGTQFGNNDLAYVYTMAYLQNIRNIGGAYFELSGDFPKGSKANHFWNAGLYFTLTPNIQFDTIVGTGINADQDIYLTGRLQIYIPNNNKKQ